VTIEWQADWRATEPGGHSRRGAGQLLLRAGNTVRRQDQVRILSRDQLLI
jgi:hypothetical protein